MNIYLTSEENSYGITFFVWRNGKEIKSRFHKKWIQHHVWMKLYPEMFLRESEIGYCSQKSHYQYFGAKLPECAKFGIRTCPRLLIILFCLKNSALCFLRSSLCSSFRIKGSGPDHGCRRRMPRRHSRRHHQGPAFGIVQ